MKNILERFGEWAISLRQNEFEQAALRLTGYYVVGIATILALSSGGIYILVSPTMPFPTEEELEALGIEFPHDKLSFYELGEHLIEIMLVVDFVILLLATAAAYAFARRTLRPIEIVYQMQERFVGDVAHELRTPLAVLKAGSQSMLLKERSKEEYVTFVKELEEETDRMIRLSNDLLFLLKHQKSRQEDFFEVNLTEVARQQVNYFQAYAGERVVGVSFHGEHSAVISGVSDGLIRLCQNLIKNAIDYNRPNGTVIVSVLIDKHVVKLSVQDTGIGIDPEDQKMIFDRFYKVDMSRPHVSLSGTGLGLAIVKNIVRTHHGELSVSSVVGTGTIISVAFPQSNVAS